MSGSNLRYKVNRPGQFKENLWGNSRRVLEDSIEDTLNAMWEVGSLYKHWIMFYSGGKDSTAVVTLLAHLIETEQIPRPENFTVLYSDTGMEVPPLQISALETLKSLEKRGIRTEVVRPELDDRFFVYMLGRGVPPPNNGRLRWCTRLLKVKPMDQLMLQLRQNEEDSLLGITGVREGESAARDQRISVACSKDGGECGQGRMHLRANEKGIATLAPILSWRVCHVWDWLTFFAPKFGFNTQIVAQIYDAENYGQDGEEPIGARTGCMECNLVHEDKMMTRLLAIDDWKYLEPITGLRPLYAELAKASMRLRKDGTQRLKDGGMPRNPNRLGPLTMDARRYGLARVLEIQEQVNKKARQQGRPEINLINEEEQARIQELIEIGTWPLGWDGDEPRGDVIIPHVVSKNLQVLQPELFMRENNS